MATLKKVPFASGSQLFGDIIHVLVDEAEKRRSEVKRLLEQEGITVEDVGAIAPSLEDAFVTQLAGLEEKPASRNVDNSFAQTVLKEDIRSDITVKVSDLTRKFGDFTAVDHVSFEIKRGEIFGLLGPNGSGKTTTIRMITGLLAPTSGSACVLGRDMAGLRGKEKAVPRELSGGWKQRLALGCTIYSQSGRSFSG